jgi:hypothetical protein
LGAEGDIM